MNIKRLVFWPAALAILGLAFSSCQAEEVTEPSSSSEETSAPSSSSGTVTQTSSSSDPFEAISMPGDVYQSDDPNNPYHEPDVDPMEISDETEPSDYNILISAPSSHDAIWAWSTGGKGVGLIPAIKNVSITGITGTTFSAIYLTYKQYYYSYSSWDFDTKGFFLAEEDDPFTGLILRSSTDGNDKTADISLSDIAPEDETGNIYVIEKDDGSYGVFGTAEEAGAFLSKDTSPIYPADATSPSDVNIYTYCPWGNQYRNNIWAWGTNGSVGFDTLKDNASKEVTLDGVSGITFNAVYLTFGQLYYGQSDWNGTTSTTFTITEPTFFTGMILRYLGGDQSGDLSIPSLSALTKDNAGGYNIYLIELNDGSTGNKNVNVYTDLADVQSFFA